MSLRYPSTTTARTVAAIYRGAFGDLAWLDTRTLADGPQAFADLDQGRAAAAKVILCP